MLTPVILDPRRRRGKLKAPSPPAPPPPPPPPVALNLVAATYDGGAQHVTLTFDRAIDIAALDGSQITVDDFIVHGLNFAATGVATLIDPATVQIALDEIEGTPAAGITLTASDATGIVAVAPVGGMWAGVTGLELPFP